MTKVKNMTVTVSFADNKARTWGYDVGIYPEYQLFLDNLAEDFTVTDKKGALSGVLFASITILFEDGSINAFALGPEVKSSDYAAIILSNIDSQE